MHDPYREPRTLADSIGVLLAGAALSTDGADPAPLVLTQAEYDAVAHLIEKPAPRHPRLPNRHEALRDKRKQERQARKAGRR